MHNSSRYLLAVSVCLFAPTYAAAQRAEAVGASVGYRAARYDGRSPAGRVRQYVIGGAAIGAVAGYGIESLVRMVSR